MSWPLTTNGGVVDAFVTKLNAAGSALVYSTYLGGSNAENGFGIAIDASGNVYVTSLTESINFPTAVSVHGSDQLIRVVSGSPPPVWPLPAESLLSIEPVVLSLLRLGRGNRIPSG